MASEAAKLLDELMGRERNLAPSEMPKVRLHFDDPEVHVRKLELRTFSRNET